jgi:hypothetical protein
VKNVKKAKAIHEKYGAEMVRLGRIATGPFVGEWQVVVRWPDWTAFGKARDALAADTEFQELLAHGASMFQATDATIIVGIDL